MNTPQPPEPIELDCPFCEEMVACREYDEVVTCPHCGGQCRQTNDYVDEKDNLIFALVPLDWTSDDEANRNG